MILNCIPSIYHSTVNDSKTVHWAFTSIVDNYSHSSVAYTKDGYTVRFATIKTISNIMITCQFGNKRWGIE